MGRLLSALKMLLRGGPITLGLMAVALLGVGYYLQLGQNQHRALNAAALANGPPPAIDIAAFDATQHLTPWGEATVQAQALFDHATPLTIVKSPSNSEAFVVPLVAATATGDILGVAIYHEAGFRADQLTPQTLLRGAIGTGTLGPLVDYTGLVRPLGQWDGPTRDALTGTGLVLRNDLIVVWPHIAGRDAVYAPPAPGEGTIFGLLSKIAGVMGLIALAQLVFAGGDRRSANAAIEPDAGEETAPVMDRAAPAAADFDQIDATKPARFGLRKLLICIVGAMFAIGLTATIWDLVAPTLSADKAPVILTGEERAAQDIAASLIPEADPNRHWTDIDVGPLAEWGVAQFYLALGGDKDAQLALGKVVGGIVFVFVMIRFFFRMRRSLRPKTTPRFDSMGLN